MGGQPADHEVRDVEPILVAEPWPELVDARKAVHPEYIAEIRDLLTEKGLFQGFIEWVSEWMEECEPIALKVEPDADEGPIEPDTVRVASAQALHDLYAYLLTAGTDESFRTHFTHDVLSHAAAWAMGDLTRSVPRERLLAMDEEAFAQAYNQVYWGKGYLTTALEALLPSYMEVAGQAALDAITANVDAPKLKDRLERAVRQALDNHVTARPTPPKPSKAGRRGVKSVSRPLVFPNEPGHRALLFSTTSAADDWQIDSERAVLDTPLRDPTRKQRLRITFDHQGADHPLALVAEMIPAADGTALKVLLALPALFFEHNPDAKYNAVHETTIPNLMRYMGLKPKGGAFDRADQERVWRAIQYVSRLWVPGISAYRKGGGQLVVTGEGTWHSPVIVLQGLQEGEHGLRLPKAVRYSLGREFHSYFNDGAGVRTRMLQLSPRIMELHAKNDLNPLRLAVYYASQFRIRKEGAKYGTVEVRVKYSLLLEQTGVPIDRVNPRRQFDRVIAWHHELTHRGIVGEVSYAEPSPSGGFAGYLQTLFTVSPPDGWITPP